MTPELPTNKAIARVLKQTADLIDLTGGNAYRARAFASAARAAETEEASVAEMALEGSLAEVRGIGTGLMRDVVALVETGTLELRDELLAALPPGLPEVLRVKGLGTKKVRAVWQNLGVTSLEDLERVAQTGELATLSGFGKKTAENVLRQIAVVKQFRGKVHLAQAVEAVSPLTGALREQAGTGPVGIAGDIRRACNTVSEAVVVAVASDDALAAVLGAHAADDPDAALSAPDGLTEARFGRVVFRGHLPGGLALTVVQADPGAFGTALWGWTGSAEHRAQLVDRHGQPGAFAEEADLFAAAGLSPIPPELREGQREWDRPAGAPALLTTADLRGSIHNHSTYSDGAHSLAEMAEAARSMGLAYFGIADHSRSLTIAHGLSIDELRRQREEVDRLNAQYQADSVDFRLFHGSEVDILEDGSLDYPDDVLAELDYVVASVHTHFDMDRAQATARLVRAVGHPLTDVLGHPTGRILLRREGYPIDHEAVLDACARCGVAVELNASPYRLDVDWAWLGAARERGVLVAINPDAHSIDGLADVRWGVAAARKGALTPDGCLNALSADAFAAWLADRRRA